MYKNLTSQQKKKTEKVQPVKSQVEGKLWLYIWEPTKNNHQSLDWSRTKMFKFNAGNGSIFLNSKSLIKYDKSSTISMIILNKITKKE